MLKRAYWWIVHRTVSRHRYHVIRTGLTPGFHDVDVRMMHACFTLLQNYVDHEFGGPDGLARHIDAMGEAPELKDQKYIEKHVLFLYLWWVNQRPKDLLNIEFLWKKAKLQKL